jgi:hypothetical protein
MERTHFSPVVLGEPPVEADGGLAFDPAVIRSTDGWKPVVIALS